MPPQRTAEAAFSPGVTELPKLPCKLQVPGLAPDWTEQTSSSVSLSVKCPIAGATRSPPTRQACRGCVDRRLEKIPCHFILSQTRSAARLMRGKCSRFRICREEEGGEPVGRWARVQADLCLIQPCGWGRGGGCGGGEEVTAGHLSLWGGGFAALAFPEWPFIKNPQDTKTSLPTSSQPTDAFCLTVCLSLAVNRQATNRTDENSVSTW